MNPLVSVIVPVYNAESYLQICVNSILVQTYKNIELILIDDGSTDNSSFLCDNFQLIDNRVRVFHVRNGGVSNARNLGIENVKGEYTIFVDSDDWLEEHVIENIMKLIPFSVAIFGCIRFYSPDYHEKVSVCTQSQNIDINSNPEIMKSLLCNSLLGYAGNKIYYTPIIKEHSFNPKGEREDLLFNIGVLKNVNKIILSSECGYYYRQHENSVLHKTFEGEIPDFFGTIELLIEKFEDMNISNKYELCNISIKTFFIDCIYKYIVHNQFLSETMKKKEIKRIFGERKFKKNISFKYNTCKLQVLFSICYKFNLPLLFYYGWKWQK